MSRRRSSGDLPLFRPRIGGRGGEVRGDRVPTLKRGVLQRLQGLDRLPGGGTRKVRRGHTVAPHVRLPSATSRRCLVKARYVRMDARGAGAARLHLRYIEREGVERDGSRGRLFDAQGDVARDVFGAEIPGEKRQFRFIVSPEDTDDLDLRDYAQRIVGQMEHDLGHDLIWAAATHHNTDNPHVHIVVRGIDRDGHDVYIPEQYIAHGLRHRAMEIATNELGPRTDLDLARHFTREAARERMTVIDRRLGELVANDGRLDMASLAAAHSLPRPHAMARLQTLERLGLVTREPPTGWRFEEGWRDRLVALGDRSDILGRMHRVLRGDPRSYRIFDPTVGDALEGVIKHKGLHDDFGTELYAIVGTERGQHLYVQVDPATAEQLKEGERVRITASVDRWLKAPDHAIAAVAAANGGTYDPAVHLRQMGAGPVNVAGRSVAPAEVVAVNVRRLERLERYRLVLPLAGGGWEVPADLVAQLRDRERTHPRSRIQVDRLDIGRDLER